MWKSCSHILLGGLTFWEFRFLFLKEIKNENSTCPLRIDCYQSPAK